MAAETIIAWTDHTINFWMGCQKVSPGCASCYAETLTRNRMGLALWGPAQTTRRQWVKSAEANVRAWDRAARAAGRSARVFCMSLGDFFEDHPDANRWRPMAWELIRHCDALDWQILTKRPERIAECLPSDWGLGWAHVWLGTSIEDARLAHRADALREVPAVVRFISYEPALGPLAEALDLTGISWVIYGGESGPGYRPEGTTADPKCWARDMRDACAAAGVAYFHKQSAGYRTELGIELDGRVIRQYPQARRRIVARQAVLF
jgi:protein gp37